MQPSRIRAARLRAHRLTTPAPSVADAARHMLAVQSQDFRAGRWALGVRTRGAPTVHDVDAAFDRAELVRSWTMRGTIHIVPAADLAWMLAVTGERQLRGLASAHRREGIWADHLARAERIARDALRGGGRLTRDELFSRLDRAGVPTTGQRGYHLLVALSLRAVVCQGPVVSRSAGPAREQHIVLVEEWVPPAAAPRDPVGELFARYIAGHGPAGARDFAWWAGLPLGECRRAAEGASDAVIRVSEGEDPLYASRARSARRSSDAPRVVALPPFDEYYLSYADRTIACVPDLLDRIGPGKNGMVAATLIADGEVFGAWTHSAAVGRHRDAPVPDILRPAVAEPSEIGAALERYRSFIGT